MTSSIAIATMARLRAATAAIGRKVVIMPLRRQMVASCFIELGEKFGGFG
jgi:hypothetical protein